MMLSVANPVSPSSLKSNSQELQVNTTTTDQQPASSAVHGGQLPERHTFNVFVFEIVKIKVRDIEAGSYAEAALKAGELVRRGADNLIQMIKPSGPIEYVETADETAYYMADLMDAAAPDDVIDSKWFSGAMQLGDEPRPEDVKASGRVGLPVDVLPAVTA